MATRKLSLSVHSWVGLIAAAFLFLEGTTGGIMAWGPEILRSINPPARFDPPVYQLTSGRTLPLAELASALERRHPGFHIVTMQFPAQSTLAWPATLQSTDATTLTVWINPQTGDSLGERRQSFRFGWVQKIIQVSNRFHGNILGGIALFFLALSGLVLWWPRKIFGIRRAGTLTRKNFDLHSAIGFYSSLFLLIFSSTAIVMAVSRPAAAIISRINHTPLPSQRRGRPAAFSIDSGQSAGSSSRPDFDQLLMKRRTSFRKPISPRCA